MPKISQIDTFIIDFDGVLTDNSVYVCEDGNESVRCSRGDGLAIQVLKKLNKEIFILSTEENKVVSLRAKKLRVDVIQGVANKHLTLTNFASQKKINLKKTLYIGNDLNDYHAMNLCSLKICPSDSHQKIKDISDFVLKSGGGQQVLREVLEDIFKIDILGILYQT